MTAGATGYSLTVDFDVSASTSVAPGHDSFAFTLRNTTNAAVVGTPLVSIGFVVPTTTSPTTTDAVNYTVGTGAAVSTGQGITINSGGGPGRYRLTLTVTAGTTPTFTASLLPVDANNNPAGSVVNLTTTGPVALTSGANVNQFSADWSLADKTTIANGGYTGAGTNALEFDNLAITVPEPSTYAMMALGLLGMTGVWRRHRRQA